MFANNMPFHFEINAEVFEKAGAEGTERRIAGIVSTDDLDSQQETLLQEGLDFTPFLKGGWFNDNHQKDTGALVGYPEHAELRTLPNGRKGWYVEGYLLKGQKRADEIWEVATALQRSGAPRRLGFSVEGQILERDPENPRTVRKAVVREVAITRCPVNDKTSLVTLAKSLSAGSAVANPGTAPGQGFPLRTESLEGYGSPRLSPKDEEDEDGKKKGKKRMRKSEAIDWLCRRRPELSREAAALIVDVAIERQGAA